MTDNRTAGDSQMDDGVYTVASDERIIALIEQARRRLIVVSPGLTTGVVDCLHRLANTRSVPITIVMDSDPEVYRLGYGDQATLETLKSMSSVVNLRLQEGIRIGLVVSDDRTMVFSPTPRMIEAGSTSIEKPNAVILSGGAPSDRFVAAGSVSSDRPREIGAKPLTAEAIERMKGDLKAKPPQPFDIARAMRVFSSEMQYVEFKVQNYQMTRRKVSLPAEFTVITDKELKKQVSSRIQLVDEDLGPFEIVVKTLGRDEKVKMTERWIRDERKRLEDTYTFVIPRHGRVLLRSKRKIFNKEVCLLSTNLERYYEKIKGELETKRNELVRRVVKEYVPRWKEDPPAFFSEYKVGTTEDNIRRELEWKARQAIARAVTVEAPTVSAIYKEISPESVRDRNGFLDPLRKAMESRKVPQVIIDNLFETFDAAPSAASD